MIEIYGTPNCTYCKQAMFLCESAGKAYAYIDLTTEPEALHELTNKIGNFRTVPQIVIDEEHVGGFQELQERLKDD